MSEEHELIQELLYKNSTEARKEIDRQLKLLAEIILEYKTATYQNAANLIWKEILREK